MNLGQGTAPVVVAANATIRPWCASNASAAAAAAAAVGNFEGSGADAVLKAIILHMVPSLGITKWATPQLDWSDERLS